MSLFRKSLCCAALLVSLTGVSACNEHPLKPATPGGNLTLEARVYDVVANNEVDLIIVVDATPDVALLVQEVSSQLAELLEQTGPQLPAINYRLLVLTSDMGNPSCEPATALGGSFLSSPCTARIGSFLDSPQLCTDVCPNGSKFKLLGSNDPNAIGEVGWIESSYSQVNLPESWSVAEGLQCMLPRGINGCSLGSPLESLYQSILEVSADDSYFRSDAVLAILFVSGSEDCSTNPSALNIYDPDGARVFWDDDSSDIPSSQICRNAGATCDASGKCVPANLDVKGKAVSDELAAEEAVLHPIERYLGLLQTIEDENMRRVYNQEIVVGVLTPGSVGCTETSDVSESVPRLRAFAEAFRTNDTESPVYSVCDNDPTDALNSWVEQVRQQVRPACFRSCVRDVDEETDGLQVKCRVERQTPDGVDSLVPECRRNGSGDYVFKNDAYHPPKGEVMCFRLLADVAQSTVGTADDMYPACVDEGSNLQFVIQRTKSSESFRLAGESIQADCELSRQPDLDCPEL